MKFQIGKITIITQIILAFIALYTDSTTQVLASRNINISQNPVEENTEKELPDPPDTGTPNGQTGGADRPIVTKCPNTERLVTAFMDRDLKVVSESPDFWFYVPYTSENVDSLSFTILNEQGQYVERQEMIPLADRPGFIKLQLPTTHPSLEVGQRYRWFFSVYCDPENNEDRISVRGVIERVVVSSDFWQELQNLTPLERINYYLEQGHPYDAFNLIAQLYENDPNNPQIQAQFQRLLELYRSSISDYELRSIDSEPILPCCSLENPKSLE